MAGYFFALIKKHIPLTHASGMLQSQPISLISLYASYLVGVNRHMSYDAAKVLQISDIRKDFL